MMDNSDIMVVSLALSPWSFPLWTSRQFLMYELSTFFPVLYLSERETIEKYMDRKYWSSLLFVDSQSPYPPPKAVRTDRIRCFFPRIYKYEKLNHLLSAGYMAALRRLYRLDKKKIVLYVWDPKLVYYLDYLDYDKLIYHPYDNFEQFAYMDDQQRQDIMLAEQLIVGKADAIITPHERVAQKFAHRNAHVVHNAVFLRAFNPATPHADHYQFERPIIGYLGVINSKIDFELLRTIATHRRGWTFLFIGPVNKGNWQANESYIAFRKLENVRFLPSISFNRVSEFMAGFDIGMMPYSLKGWAAFCESPLKMYQYWALGKPIVSVPLPNIAHRPGIISVCEGAGDWVDAIENELEKNNPERIAMRKDLAAMHSWENRAKTVYGIICDLYR